MCLYVYTCVYTYYVRLYCLLILANLQATMLIRVVRSILATHGTGSDQVTTDGSILQIDPVVCLVTYPPFHL